MLKRWYVYMLILVLLIPNLPFSGHDIAELQPVSLVSIQIRKDGVLVSTDTEQQGEGRNLQEAFANLRMGATGTIMLDTANYIVCNRMDQTLALQLRQLLRPGCGICLCDQTLDLAKAVAFLDAKRPKYSLLDCCINRCDLQRLVSRGEQVSYE